MITQEPEKEMHKLQSEGEGKVMGEYFSPGQVGNYVKIPTLPKKTPKPSQQVQEPKKQQLFRTTISSFLLGGKSEI